jgi:ribonuclease Z
MVDVCLLGCGGKSPQPNRSLTSMFIRSQGVGILIDAGEGTQVNLKACHISCKSIDVICLTHYHADHTLGLPGVLNEISNTGRKEPVTIMGPKGLDKILDAVKTLTPVLGFPIIREEIPTDVKLYKFAPFLLTAFSVKHTVPCYGYSIYLERHGKVDIEKAEANDVPSELWPVLQSGEDVEIDGIRYEPSMILGPERKGIKVTYATDTLPCDNIAKHGYKSDLMILEGMYDSKENYRKSRVTRHMMFNEAAKIAKDADAEELWLTHYSPRLADPRQTLAKIRNIFPNTYVNMSLKVKTLSFQNDKLCDSRPLGV